MMGAAMDHTNPKAILPDVLHDDFVERQLRCPHCGCMPAYKGACVGEIELEIGTNLDEDDCPIVLAMGLRCIRCEGVNRVVCRLPIEGDAVDVVRVLVAHFSVEVPSE